MERLKENKKSLKEAQSAITMQEVIKALKNLRQNGYSVNVKNKGFIVSTYERDMYFAGYLQDLLDYANAHINELDNPDDLDELTYLVDDYVNSECERAWAHHSFEIPEMKEKVKKLRQKYLGESLEEDLENLEKVDATTTMNTTMGTAKEESKTLWQRLEDAEKIPEDAPLFGAEDQPVPEEVEGPKVTLDESLFTEGLSASYFGKLAAKAAEAIEDFQDAFTGLPYDFDMLIQDEEVIALDNAREILYQVEGRARDLTEDVSDKELNESSTEDDDVELSDEAIKDILDDVKGVFDECEFTTDEVVDKIFDCIEDESKVEFAQGILDSMEEDKEELTEGVDTFEDSLAVIKKYFNGRKASEVIDTIFTNNPAVDSDKLEEVAIKLGQFLDDYLDECKLAENFI